jgi:hypothetical protein
MRGRTTLEGIRVTTAPEHYLPGAFGGAAACRARGLVRLNARSSTPLRTRHRAGSVLLFLA